MIKRLVILLVALAVCVIPLQAATITLIPEAVHGTIAFGHAGDSAVSGCSFCGPTPVHINAGTPANHGNIDFTIISSVWTTTSNLTWRVVIEKSLDGGITWSFLMGNDPSDPTNHFISNVLDKFGQPALAAFGTVWNGNALDLRGTFTPGPAPFSWGISASF